MRNFPRWFLASGLAFALAVSLRAATVEVEAEGKAAGDVANAREQALTDALREAVRKGAGVDVVSSTAARDFALDYDRVFAAAFGHVRKYTVLRSGLGADGIYRVTLRAEVGEGQPAMRDALALKQIVHLKQSPRVSLEMDELIEGLPAGSEFAKAWFEQAAREMQLHLVDLKRVARQSDRLATRDEFFGDRQGGAMRRAGFALDTDFVIQARVRGRSLGREVLYGLPTTRFSFAVDLRAIRPETGAVLASIPLPGREINSEAEAPETAARDILHRLLSSDPKLDYPGGWALFRKIFANWLAELDLGAIMRLEFREIGNDDFDRLQRALGETEKITAVWPREFDSKGMSFMDVESRLDASGLKSAILKALGSGWRMDRTTPHYLQFTRAAGGLPPAEDRGALRPSAASEPRPSGASVPGWAWALMGAGGAGILFGIYQLGRRSAGGKAP